MVADVFHPSKYIYNQAAAQKFSANEFTLSQHRMQLQFANRYHEQMLLGKAYDPSHAKIFDFCGLPGIRRC